MTILIAKIRETFYGWWIVLACGSIFALHGGLLWYGFGVLLKPIANEFHWSRAATAAAFSIAYVEGIFLAPVTGWAIDRFGPRGLSIGGVLLTVVGLLALPFMNSLTALYVIYALFIGLGSHGTNLTAFAAAVARWFVRRRAFAIGCVATGGALGGVILTPLILFLVDGYGWRATAAILGLLMFLAGIPLSLVIKPGFPETYGLHPDGDPSVKPETLGESSGKSPPPSLSWDYTIHHIWKRWSFWLLTLAWWCSSLTLTSVTVHLVPFLTDKALSVQWVAAAVQVLTVSIVASRFIFPWIADRYDIRYAYAVAFLLMLAGLIFLQFSTPLLLIFLGVSLFGLGQGSIFPLRSAIIGPYFARETFGTVQGWISSFGSTGGLLGPILAGYVFDTTGSYGPALILNMAVCGLAVLVVISLPRPSATR